MDFRTAKRRGINQTPNPSLCYGTNSGRENGNVNQLGHTYHLKLFHDSASSQNTHKFRLNSSCSETPAPSNTLEDGPIGRYNKSVHSKSGLSPTQFKDEIPSKNNFEEKDFDPDTILSILCGSQSNNAQEAPANYKSRLKELLLTGKVLPACNHNPIGEPMVTSNLTKSSLDEVYEPSDPLAITFSSNSFNYLKVPILNQDPPKKLIPDIQRPKDTYINARDKFYSSLEWEKLGNSNGNLKQSPRAAQNNHTKKKKKPMIGGKKRVRLLIKELSIATYCRSKVDVITIRKVTNTIRCLQNRSAEMATTYSRLMLLNQELCRQKSILLSELSGAVDRAASFAHESSIVSHIPEHFHGENLITGTDLRSEASSKTSKICDFRIPVEETYELNYDSQSPCRITDTESSSCGQIFCRLGCVCDSLNAGIPLLDHCQIPACMFECSCSDDEDEDEALISTYNTPLNQRISSSSRAQSTTKDPQPIKIESSSKSSSQPAYLHLENNKLSILKSREYLLDSTGRMKPRSKDGKFLKGYVISTTTEILPDKKLFQQCQVRLKRMNICCRPSTQKKFPIRKLFQKTFIPLIKLKLSPSHKVYCMDHCRYECSCFNHKRKIR